MTAHDAFNDPYARRATARRMRVKFEAWKRSPEHARWRKAQIKVQGNKCAWCRVKLIEHIVVHIDHVTPLYYDGKNTTDNLVLSCKRCNLRKWISNKYVMPQWIKDAHEQQYRQRRARALRDEQYRQVRDTLDDIALEQISSWC